MGSWPGWPIQWQPWPLPGSIYSHLPLGGTPLWLGFKEAGSANAAAVPAALA